MTALVRADLLQPFDVILSRPRRAKVSQKIAMVTRSRYSHATIVVNRSLRFEAVGRGLTYTPVQFVACGFNEQSLVFLEDVSAYRYFDVFRHPDLMKADPSMLSRVEDRLIELTSALVYQEYPSLDAFRNVIRRTGLAAHLVDRLLAILARTFQTRRFLPGPFCSALVAMLFEDSGMPAFDTLRPHDSVTPGDLACSRLERVTVTEDLQLRSLANDELLLEEANALANVIALADRSYRANQTLRIGFERLKGYPSLLLRHDEEVPRLIDDMLARLRQRELLSHAIALNRRFWPAMGEIEQCFRTCSLGCKLPRYCKVNSDRVTVMVADLQKQIDAVEDRADDA